MRFEPFAIDTQRWRLLRLGQTVDLSPRLVEILAYLASRPGHLVSKDELLDRFWPDVHVTENTLTRAIADIRKALGDRPDPPQFIQTVSRHGYRFIASVERTPTSPFDESGSEEKGGSKKEGGSKDPPLQEAFVDWVRGRAVLESLDASGLAEATAAFERAVAGTPGYAPAHVGLANACFLRFEQSRVGNVLDQAALDRAMAHARRAIALDETMGEAWATLGFVLAAAGHVEESRAAARHAVAIEPTSWRHHYRLAVATWGEERLRAVDRTLALLPRFPAAYLLSAMVSVARGAIGPAREAAHQGALGQRQQVGVEGLPLPVAGLHWMTGLVDLARGGVDRAMEAFDREISGADDTHVYGREFLINALVSQGFLHLQARRRDAARRVFSAALDEVPGHARSRVGLALLAHRQDHIRVPPRDLVDAPDDLRRGGKPMDAVLVDAAVDAWCGRTTDAIAKLAHLIDDAPPGATGWSIAVDPMFFPLHGIDGFETVRARVAARAV